MQLAPKYVVDKGGRKREVLLTVRDYEKLMQELEDLRDALELEDRARTVKQLVPYEEVRKRLKAAGRL